MKFLSLGFALAGLLSFCGAQSGTMENPSSEVDIYGGTKVVEGDYNHVVALTGMFGAFCSGTLVHPQVVITAAHCVYRKSPRSIRVYVGPGKRNGFYRGQHKVSSLKAYPEFSMKQEDIVGTDVGVIVLQKPINNIAIDPILLDSMEIDQHLAEDEPITLVGFGQRPGGGTGIKYQVDTYAGESFNGNEILIGGEGKGGCYGDSGGPAFVMTDAGERKVFGITSRGSKCGEAAVWGMMHPKICWFEENSGFDLDGDQTVCSE